MLPGKAKKEFSEYAQELRTITDAMQLHFVPKTDLVTIFMERLRTGVARAEMPGPPTSSEADVSVALNAKFNFKASRFGTHGYNPNSASSFSSSIRPDPMDFSLAETDEEAELRDVELHRNIRRRCTFGSTRHLCRNVWKYKAPVS